MQFIIAHTQKKNKVQAFFVMLKLNIMVIDICI